MSLGWINATTFKSTNLNVSNDLNVTNDIQINGTSVIDSNGTWVGTAGKLARTNYNFGIVSEITNMTSGVATYDNFDALGIDRKYPLYLYPGISINKSAAVVNGLGMNSYHHPNNMPLGSVFQGGTISDNINGTIKGINFSIFSDDNTECGLRFLVEVHRPSWSSTNKFKIKDTLVKVGISNLIVDTFNGTSDLFWIEDSNKNTASAQLSNYLTTNTGVYNTTTKQYDYLSDRLSGIYNWNSNSITSSTYFSKINTTTFPGLSNTNGNIKAGDTISVSVVKYATYNKSTTAPTDGTDAVTSNIDFLQIQACPYIITTSDDS